MDLQSGEEIVYEGHPSWRATLEFYGAGAVVAVLAGIVAALIWSAGVGIAVGLVVFALAVVGGYLRRMGTHYVVTTHRLRIQRGILSRSVQQTRLDRVQNVNTEQSFIDRILQVGTVDFDTAGTDDPDADFTFRGIGQPASVAAVVDRAQQAASGRERQGL